MREIKDVLTESRNVLNDVLIWNEKQALIHEFVNSIIEEANDLFEISEPAGYGAGYMIDYVENGDFNSEHIMIDKVRNLINSINSITLESAIEFSKKTKI